MAACKYCGTGGQNSNDPFCDDGCRRVYNSNGGRSAEAIKHEEEVRRWKAQQKK